MNQGRKDRRGERRVIERIKDSQEGSQKREEIV